MSINKDKNNINKSNSILWSELKKGNPDALKKLFHQFYNDLYFYGKKLSKDDNHIKDTIQDIFAYLWENRKSLSNVEYVKAYIFKIFRNKLLKPSNKKTIYTLTDNDKRDIDFVISHEDLIAEHETQIQTSKIISLLLKDLSDKQREIIFLRFYCDLSITEISQSLSIEKQSVSNSLNRIFNTLRKKLTKNNLLLLLILLKFWTLK